MARTRRKKSALGAFITLGAIVLVIMLFVSMLNGFNPSMEASGQETESESQPSRTDQGFQEYDPKEYETYWSEDARSMSFDELEKDPVNTDRSDSKENNQKRINNLERLPVIDPLKGYDRDDYLPNGWPAAEDGGWDLSEYGVEGCDVRDAILIRDGKNVEVTKDCKIHGGNWVDPYGFHSYDEDKNEDTYLIDQMFEKPGDMDIEHIVSLSRIHQSGGQNMTDEEKQKIATDPNNLIVTAASSNRSKGDMGPAEYMPYNPEYVCTFTEKYTDVLLTYGLGILPAPEGELNDRDVLINNLENCMEGK